MIPKISLVVGACALTFQATVLYPWHNKISQDINDLKTRMDKILPKEKNVATTQVKDSSCSFKGLSGANIFYGKKYMDFAAFNPKHPYYFYEHMKTYKTNETE